MKITVTFNTLEEFDAFRGAPTIWREVPAPAEEKKVEPVKKEPEVPFEEGPMPAPEPAPEPEPEKKAENVDPGKLRIECRKALAKLNRAVEGKPASKLIKDVTGAEIKLTDVAPEFLPEILRRAEEGLKNAE
jgi:hypothetical protein